MDGLTHLGVKGQIVTEGLHWPTVHCSLTQSPSRVHHLLQIKDSFVIFYLISTTTPMLEYYQAPGLPKVCCYVVIWFNIHLFSNTVSTIYHYHQHNIKCSRINKALTTIFWYRASLHVLENTLISFWEEDEKFVCQVKNWPIYTK